MSNLLNTEEEMIDIVKAIHGGKVIEVERGSEWVKLDPLVLCFRANRYRVNKGTYDQGYKKGYQEGIDEVSPTSYMQGYAAGQKAGNNLDKRMLRDTSGTGATLV